MHVPGPLLGLIPARRRWPRRWGRALLHELACAGCRVSWRSWRRRLLGDARGYSPSTHG
jgi:hypothetical protein